MNKLMLVLLMGVVVVSGQNVSGVYFNEVRYDDDGSDDCEFIELIGPAGTDLSGMTIVHYNGASSSDGGLFVHTIEETSIPDDGLTDRSGTALGFFVLALSDDGTSTEVENWDELFTTNMQNSVEALVLYQSDELSVENVLDAIAWGDMSGGDILEDDPGFVSTDVSLWENNYLHMIPTHGGSDESIQNSNLVMNNDGSGWQIAEATPGAANSGQDGGLVELPVELTNFQARGDAEAIRLSWQTETEQNNLGFEIYRAKQQDGEYCKIASFITDANLKGKGTTSQQHAYHFTDANVKFDQTYWYAVADVDYNGIRTRHEPVSARLANANHAAQIVTAFCLHPNYPNPFNPVTHVQLDLPQETRGTLSVYDMLGKYVITLQSGIFTAGQHRLSWNGMDDSGRNVGSGIYFITFQSPDYHTTIKAVLTR